jgi:hypothetical protein
MAKRIWEGDKHKYGKPKDVVDLINTNHRIVKGDIIRYLTHNQMGVKQYEVIEVDHVQEPVTRKNPENGKYLWYKDITTDTNEYGGGEHSKSHGSKSSKSKGGATRRRKRKARKTRKGKKTR